MYPKWKATSIETQTSL